MFEARKEEGEQNSIPSAWISMGNLEIYKMEFIDPLLTGGYPLIRPKPEHGVM